MPYQRIDDFLSRNDALIEKDSIEDLLTVFTSFARDSVFLFRGHSNTDFRLIPSIERIAGVPYWQKESSSIEKFSRAVHLYLPQEQWPNSIIEKLALMQHFGAPTRLIDFTKSPYVALYFAVQDYTVDGAVWCVLPHNLKSLLYKELYNKNFTFLEADLALGSFERFLSRDHYYDRLFRNDYSFITDIRPFKMNDRLLKQQGTFLISSNSNIYFDDLLINMLSEMDESLDNGTRNATFVKIIIQKKFKKDLMRYLNILNINYETLFGGLEGLSKFIGEQMSYSSIIEYDRY